jgi:ATP-dependent Clp protease ATP-binding subunit ClpA
MDVLVTQGYSPGYGARFLKRIIDERITLPISQRWRDVKHFHVTLDGEQMAIGTKGLGMVACAEPQAIAV